MEEKQGWERPSFFIENEIVRVPSYDWQGAYGNTKLPEDNSYKRILNGDAKYGFSDHHELVRILLKFLELLRRLHKCHSS